MRTQAKAQFLPDSFVGMGCAERAGSLALLAAGANVDAKAEGDDTPLMRATQANHPAVAEVLIRSGGDVHAAIGIGDTPLNLAGSRDNVGLATLMIEKGADVNHADEDGKTPLYVAARAGLLGVASQLVKHGADPDAKANGGITPVDVAARRKDAKMTNLLVEARKVRSAASAPKHTAQEAAAPATRPR